MAWPTSHSECGFDLAEWTETSSAALNGLSCFLFVSHKMRGGYLLEHQAVPDLHDLPLVLGDPESGEGEGLKKELWSLSFTVLCYV